MFVGHNGVVVKLVEAGLKTASLQPEIVKALLSAFHTDKDTKCCVPLFLTITAYEVYSEHKEKMEKDKDIKRVSLSLGPSDKNDTSEWAACHAHVESVFLNT